MPLELSGFTSTPCARIERADVQEEYPSLTCKSKRGGGNRAVYRVLILLVAISLQAFTAFVFRHFLATLFLNGTHIYPLPADNPADHASFSGDDLV